MQIYYGQSDISFEAFDKLSQHDTYNSGKTEHATTTSDGILDETEIDEAGGFDVLMQELNGFCVGFTPRGPLGAYDVVPILTSECVVSEPAGVPLERAVSSVPNYTGDVINIPGGQFEMGSINGDSDESTSTGETVAVTMSDFRLSKTEVTIGQYKAYLEATGDPEYSKLPDFEANKKGDDYPVVGLTYNEKIQFCEYYGGTLPTAAQIEYASKGRSHTDPYGTPIDKAIIYSNGARATAEVCGENDERANDYGVCDLAGNVWETTLDAYDARFYDLASSQDPSNPLTESSRYYEVRGGSWNYIQRNARSANRLSYNPDYRYFIIGFRCAWPQDS